jgi:hypothetical protein
MLTVDSFIEAEAQRDGVGCPKNIEAATSELKRLVGMKPGITFMSVAPLVMEHVAVREKHLKDIAIEQRREGNLQFHLEPPKKKPQPGTRLYPR